MGLGEGLHAQTAPKGDSAHLRVISNAPAKFEVSLMNGFCAMRGTDTQRFLSFRIRMVFYEAV